MYRVIHCEIWRDGWFGDLGSDEQHVFMYLFSSPDGSACGAYKVTPKIIANDTNIDRARVVAILKKLCEPWEDGSVRVSWWPEIETVFVHNFYKHQKSNQYFAMAAAKAAEKIDAVARETIYTRYPELRGISQNPPKRRDDGKTPSVPSAHGVNTVSTPSQDGLCTVSTPSDISVSVSGTELRNTPLTPQGAGGAMEADERGAETEARADHEPAIDTQSAPKFDTASAFSEFWETWPKGERKVARGECEKKYRRKVTSAVAHATVMAALRQDIASDGWQRGFSPLPATWINQNRWERDADIPESTTSEGYYPPHIEEALRRGVEKAEEERKALFESIVAKNGGRRFPVHRGASA